MSSYIRLKKHLRKLAERNPTLEMAPNQDFTDVLTKVWYICKKCGCGTRKTPDMALRNGCALCTRERQSREYKGKAHEDTAKGLRGLDVSPKRAREFWERVATTDNIHDCWIFKRADGTTGKNRLKFLVDGKTQYPCYIVAYALTFGEVKPGKLGLHDHGPGGKRCDSPNCCNPYHLQIGTHQDNMRDRDRTGTTLKGEDHGSAKLSDEQIAQIFEMRDRGMMQVDIGNAIGIGQQQVSRILRGAQRYIEGVEIEGSKKPLRHKSIFKKITRG